MKFRTKYKSPFADVVKTKKPPKPKTIRERFELSIDAVADADILEELSKHPNKSEYVRKLIREDIERGK